MHQIEYMRSYFGKSKKKSKETIATRQLYEIANRSSTRAFAGSDKKYHSVYVIRHKRSGCFYIGVHTDSSPHSILRTYFTSSRVIKTIMEQDGIDSFIVEHEFYFKSRIDANFIENVLIKSNSPNTNWFILNKAFQDTQKGRQRLSEANITDWPTSPYKNGSIRVNPQCVILNPNYIFKNTISCRIPKILLNN